ncbi:MAG: HAD family hydrolase [Acidobacteriota bacterium]|nr:HAD family hydrolase [Acidobacteriota bacterium]
MNKKQAHVTLVRAAEGFQHDDELPRGFDWRGFDAYLFDIDGTLANFRDQVHYEAYCNAIQSIYGHPISLEGLAVNGSTDRLILLEALLRAGIPEKDVRASIPGIADFMCTEVERRAAELRPELCPAVPRLLEELKQNGKRLGVASGNLERIGRAKLKSAGLDEYFEFAAFCGTHETRTQIFQSALEAAHKKLGKKAKVCFVGDTPADVLAAKGCGAPVIAVATGIFSLVELGKEGPDMCIPACETLWRYSRL